MKQMACKSILLLACITLLIPGDVNAQARGPAVRDTRDRAPKQDEESLRAAQVAQMEAWLRRLVGRYRISGEVDQITGSGPERTGRRVDGAADCIGIGDGPGVHCLVNAEWGPIVDRSGTPTMSEYFTMRPAHMLFGIDPDGPVFRYLRVDHRSRTFYAQGFVDGDVGVFSVCANPRGVCGWTMRITARPGSDVVRMDTSIFGGTNFSFVMHREPQLPAGEKPK